MEYEEFMERIIEEGNEVSITDLWDFQEHYQNLLNFKENKLNFLKFMEESD